jgi:hypothetical protein
MAINTTFGAFLQLTLSLFNAVTEFTLMFSRGGEPLNSSEKATALFLLSSIVTMTMEEIKVEYRVLGVALRYTSALGTDGYRQKAQ